MAGSAPLDRAPQPASPRSARKTRPRRILTATARRARAAARDQVTWQKYGAAVLGVALASAVIALVGTVVRIENISLLYLPAVLWLAARYGRGPAVAASVLAFLAYDFFFIRPLYVFTVDDPTEWLSLFALLATALVIGQLTATVQARAREAIASHQEAVASEQRTATLYALAQLLVSTTDSEALYAALTRRVAEVFAPAGVRGCALLLPNESHTLVVRALAPAENQVAAALDLTVRENVGQASWVFERCTPVGGKAPSAATSGETLVRYYVPLKSAQQVVGVLGIVGTDAIRKLMLRARTRATDTPAREASVDPQRDLFAAFCDQIALTLDRAALQQQAIHAEALQESDRLKNVLLGSVTHDLRTPLASIKAATSSLLQPGVTWSDADRQELLRSIDTSADRLNRLVGNLLDLSRLEAGVAVPVKDWYLIGDVIATVLDRLDLAGQAADHRMVVHVPPDIPLVPLDYGQIEQVLTNLVENALRYSPVGSEIEVSARTLPSEELEVRVVDHGIGIPPDELHAIFDKFYRVQHVRLPWATERPPVGTGLGLAICKSIIEAHGGRIWAESQPNVGSTFIFTLPIPEATPHGALPEIALQDTDSQASASAPTHASTTAQEAVTR
jgi:two-component system sensor histidine kinase KdpD